MKNCADPASKAKIKGVFTSFLVSMVTYDVKIMNDSYLVIISLLNDTILLSLSNTEWFCNFIKVNDKQQGL